VVVTLTAVHREWQTDAAVPSSAEVIIAVTAVEMPVTEVVTIAE